MTKVLILAYDFPPYVSVGGLRPYSWYNFLHEYGIYPVVVTRQWDNKFGNHLDYIAESASTETIIEETAQGKIIKTAFKPNFANRLMQKYGENRFIFLRKLVSAYYELAQFMLPIGSKIELYNEAKKYLEKNAVDVIIATGDPYVLFKYASKLSQTFSTPWIADYRDIWSQNNYIKNKLLKIINAYFEISTTKNAVAIITVSKFLEANISQLVKNKPFYILPNGFDPIAIEASKSIEQKNDTLRIAFVGSIYSWNPIELFLRTVLKFIQNRPEAKIMLNFYGINMYGFNFTLEDLIDSKFPELKKYICVHKKISNELVLKELASQNLMLLFNLYAVMGTKIFDYIGIKRAILFCFENDTEANEINSKNTNIPNIPNYPNSLQADLIRETQSGYVIQDSEHLFRQLNNLHDEFDKKGYIACNSIQSDKYSRKNQVKQLAQIIHSIKK